MYTDASIPRSAGRIGNELTVAGNVQIAGIGWNGTVRIVI